VKASRRNPAEFYSRYRDEYTSLYLYGCSCKGKLLCTYMRQTMTHVCIIAFVSCAIRCVSEIREVRSARLYHSIDNNEREASGIPSISDTSGSF
jgi:hypothetical protein